jgi:hypothetical protein
MKHLKEGNLYNIEDEVKNKSNSSSVGISELQMEIRKQIIDILRRQNIPNIKEVIEKTFGQTLDKL